MSTVLELMEKRKKAWETAKAFWIPEGAVMV